MTTSSDPVGHNGLRQAITDVSQKLNHRFNQLPPRDQLALTWLGGFLALLILVYGILLPTVRFHENARQNFQTQQQLLQWLKQQQPAVQALTTAMPATSVSAGNPLTVVNSSAKDFELKISRLQPENNGNLRVWMEDVSFENTLRWLHHLQIEGMLVKEITVDQQKEGMVSVRVVF